MVPRVGILSPMQEKMRQAKTSIGGVQLVRSHESLFDVLVALVAEGIVGTARGIPVPIKIANLSPSCITLPMRMKVANCVAPPQS